MRQFDSPVSQFRYDLQKAGEKSLAFETEGHFYQLSSIYGETDLVPCFKRCKLQSGFYALVSPRYEGQTFLEIAYQCSYCDSMQVKVYNIEKARQYSEQEKMFLSMLVNDVMLKRSQEDPEEYEKRKKSDIWKRSYEEKERMDDRPNLRKILQPGPNDGLRIKIGSESYEIASLFGETNLIPCPNKCVQQRGIYAVVTPKIEEQPYIQILYQCDACEQIQVKNYDIRDLYQYSKDEYNFNVIMVQDIFIPRGKLGALELSQRKKIDIIVDKTNLTVKKITI